MRIIIFLFLFSSGLQAILGQQITERTRLPRVSGQDFCFEISKPGKGGCPVGEDIPYGTPLLEAMRQRDIPTVKRLIAEGANVNEADEKGLLPLILAARGDLELIDILLAANADVNIEGRYGATALGNSTICSQAVKKFLAAGANVDYRNVNKQTALMNAAQNRNFESVKMLLAANADISAKDVEEMTPLLYAVKSGSLEITKFLYEKGEKDLSDETAAIALFYAAGNVQPEMMKFLLQIGLNPNARQKYGATAITTAAMRNNTENIKLLIEAGADVSIRGSQTAAPLTWASTYGYTEVVKLLIAAKSDVNVKENWSPLISAARNNHVETMKVLLNAGAKINALSYDRKTALMYAAWTGKYEAVKFLIDNKADVNVRDKYDNLTALSIAKANKNEAIARLLEENGAIE